MSSIDPSPTLPLRDDLRLEGAGTVPQDIDLDRAGLAQHRLRPGAVTSVPIDRTTPLMLVIAEMIGDLALQRGLDHQPSQLCEQTALAVHGQSRALRFAHELRDQPTIHHRDV